MGTIYEGPFRDEIGRHEGYAARIRPDGTETGTWTYETRETVGHRAHCECGWRGQHRYGPDEHGEELAVEEWDHDHLRPLVLARAEKRHLTARDVLEFAWSLRAEAVARHTDPDGQWLTDRGQKMCAAADELDHFLEERITGDRD